VRDVAVIRNEANVEQAVGPVRLAPGQTYRLPFQEPGELQFACSTVQDGQLRIVVLPPPVAGWPRLRWRIARVVAP
jgi:hypothetical protein